AVPPEVQSVRDLSPELVVEAAVRCLRAVRPALGAPLSPRLPPGISARFRLASDLAAACQVPPSPPAPPNCPCPPLGALPRGAAVWGGGLAAPQTSAATTSPQSWESNFGAPLATGGLGFGGDLWHPKTSAATKSPAKLGEQFWGSLSLRSWNLGVMWGIYGTPSHQIPLKAGRTILGSLSLRIWDLGGIYGTPTPPRATKSPSELGGQFWGVPFPQELGFGGDVGYQTFLYSSEHDTRRLLLFLVEKLPRDEGERGAEPPGKSGALLRAVGARIREQLGTPWVPPVCRTPRLQRL
ncbi:hypothetical protein DV515_00019956, partial [Chloebia gouldiae]